MLGRKEFSELLGPLHTILENDLAFRVLTSVPVLAGLTKAEREKVVAAFATRDFADRALVAKAGTPATFLVVKSGGLRVVRGGREEQLAQGAYLGERALLGAEATDGDVFAVGATSLFVLERATFEAIVGNVQGFMRRPSAAAHAPSAASGAGANALPAGPAAIVPAGIAGARRSNIRKEDLDILRTLGAGTFGRVKLVRHRPTNRPFALKILQKAQVVSYGQQRNVMNERNVLMAIDHPFVLKLETTFKDANCLYMLLELVQGGELFTYLANTKLGYVPVDDARFYAACVLSGLEALHEQSILYRDLKPENMLIDAAGYIKIVDMGFAKVVKDRSYTLCGTPEYLAPELVLGQGHYKGVDYWALGVLIYEMVSGHSPFYDPKGNDQMKICSNIVKGKLVFPSHVKDSNLRDVVTKLLTRTVTNRLGCRKEGIEEIKQHKFFKVVDWPALLGKKLTAPWVPPLKDAFDSGCFDAYEGDESIAPYQDDGSGWDAEF